MDNKEIQVGEYVRTKSGNIGKVLDITNVTMQKRKKYLIKWNMYKAYYITTLNIVKHSSNIIDLIGVGDYVRLYAKLGDKEYIDNISSYVCNVGKNDDKSFIELDYGQDGTEFVYNAYRIKSIVTKQQFKAMEYEVSEEDDKC